MASNKGLWSFHLQRPMAFHLMKLYISSKTILYHFLFPCTYHLMEVFFKNKHCIGFFLSSHMIHVRNIDKIVQDTFYAFILNCMKASRLSFVPSVTVVKFIYSEKATKFCEIFSLLLTTVHTVKSKLKISQNFVAFSKYVNFNITGLNDLNSLFGLKKSRAAYTLISG